jgi:NADPH-dependent curcumin reductase CurA
MSLSQTTTREIRLAARPEGEPKPSDFELVEGMVDDLADGQLLVRNTWMSVDPYMRSRMNDAKSYVPPFRLGAPLEGGAVGVVVASTVEGFAEGDTVLHQLGWRELAVVDARAARKVDTAIAPARAYLGVLGMPGLTAYVGLTEIGGLRDDDIVFVSGAAGAVGSIAGQIAKLRGHTVIGSAGSSDKVSCVTDELGFDACFNYKDGSPAELLARAAPDGIDLYFDNVGGEHLEAALGALRTYGRVAMCGAISQYNATEPAPGPRNIGLVVGKRLTLRGFIVSDHGALMKQFLAEVGPWVHDGRLQVRETVVEGLENAPDALIGLLRGDNTGKMLVKIGEE